MSKRDDLQETIKYFDKSIKRDKERIKRETDPAIIKYLKENIEWKEAKKRIIEITLLILDAKERGEDTTLLQKELDDLKKKYPI